MWTRLKKVKLGLKGRGLGKFRGGILINITPTKVPRLIGKKGIHDQHDQR